MTDWSPAHYLKFADERTRAARDLLAHVRTPEPHSIVDVGCGPGTSTELLALRYPQAAILGIDSSPGMLQEAHRRLPQVRFELADASDWTPPAGVDLVFANALYQWIPDHLEQLRRVFAALRFGATLAVQMPDNLAEPSHRLMSEVAEAGPWRSRLDGVARTPLPPAGAYYDTLQVGAARVDLWRTAYQHVLADAAAIVEFFSSTALRSFLQPLSAQERAEYLALYTARISRAYPALADGRVMLAFPRFFLVAERG